jgi:hypothetical protein
MTRINIHSIASPNHLRRLDSVGEPTPFSSRRD